MWVVLAQLDMLETAEEWGNRHGIPWDAALADLVPDRSESPAQRWLLRHIMKG